MSRKPGKTAVANNELYRMLPSVQELLDDPALSQLPIHERYLKQIIQNTIHKYREKITRGRMDQRADRETLKRQIVAGIQKAIRQLGDVHLKRVINGTGIILHTNLGRAPVAAVAREHLNQIVENYCNLEYDLQSGKRGNRNDAVEDILCLITGAEAAVVVNNNAAAVLLVLNSFCNHREVPVSRGELVEIGGAFRMPDVMKASGTRMVEVGTTNKTHFADYEEAMSEKTAAILKVHTSNYRILGFSEDVGIPQLAELAHAHDVPLIYDMGSGVMEDLRHWGCPPEPVVREFVEADADVVTFSGDKMLGGPQCGIIVGQKKFIQKVKKNHLLRALRCDKLTYAVLEATLRLYLNPDELPGKLPVAEMLTVSREALQERGKRIASELGELPLQISIVDAPSQMGSGALPLEKIPSVAIRIQSMRSSIDSMARRLRTGTPAVVGYIEQDSLFLNLRTIRADEIPLVIDSIQAIFK